MKEILRTLGKRWIELVTGPLSFLFLLGGLLMSDPTASKASWVGAYFSGLVAAVSVLWKERSVRLGQAGRRRLLRVIDDGERRVAELEQATARQDGILLAAANLQAWWRDGMAAVKAECPRAWDHFEDLDDLGPDQMEEQARRLIRRIRELLDVCAPR